MASRKRATGSATVNSSKKIIKVSDDAFECPVCYEAMVGRIFLCPNGHEVCEDCLLQLKAAGGECPSCKAKFPPEAARNFGMEKLAATCSFPCRWKCGVVDHPSVLQPHHVACPCRPVTCIMDECRHRCSPKDMKDHIRSQHGGFVRKGESFEFALDAASPAEWFQVDDGYDCKFDSVVFTTEVGPVAMTDIRLENNMFLANMRHFDDPLLYTVAITRGSYQLTFRGPTSSLHEIGADEHICVCMKAGKNLVYNSGKSEYCMSVNITASKAT